MFAIDCAGCPAAPRACDGCIVTFLESGSSQVEERSAEPCGYVLPHDVRAAIEVLRDVGMVSTVEILASFPAA